MRCRPLATLVLHRAATGSRASTPSSSTTPRTWVLRLLDARCDRGAEFDGAADGAQALVGLPDRVRQDGARLVAVLAAILVLIAVLAIGVGLRWSGPVLAASAVTSALVAELGVLLLAWTRAKSSFQAITAA